MDGAFTETVEARNPALVATGLAVWGWVLRLVVALSFLILPVVITSVTPVTEYGPHLQVIAAAYPTQVSTLRALDPTTRDGLRASPPAQTAVARAVDEIERSGHVSAAVAVQRLLGLRAMPAADRAYLGAHSQAVLTARQQAPGQWRTWWWVCAAGQVAFLPTVFLLRGRWRPSVARQDRAEHERMVAAELALLAPAGPAGAEPAVAT